MRTGHFFKFALCALVGVVAWRAWAQEELPSQLRVTTEPEGALIFCDGNACEPSPATITGLASGEHLILAQKQGHIEARATVTLSPGQKAAVELKLDPVTGLLLVHSTPSGSDVAIDGAFRGRTPLLVSDLALGSHRLRVSSAGYQTKEVDVAVKDRIPHKEAVELRLDSAIIALDSEPQGAKVTLNGADKGVTPCRLERIPVGECSLELTLEGYHPHKQQVKLESGETHEVKAVLKPIPSALTIVSVPPGARIYLENQFRGDAPVTLRDMNPGSYRIRAELLGHEPMARTIELGQASSLVEEFRLARNSGMLVLTTEPAGVKVFVDGVADGSTLPTATGGEVSLPLELDTLTAGMHKVQLSKEGYFSSELSVAIETNKSVTIHEKLRRRFIPNYEVRTAAGTIKGVFIERTPEGDVKLETRPGVTTKVLVRDILFHGQVDARELQ